MTIKPAYHHEMASLVGPVWDATGQRVYCNATCADDAGADYHGLIETTPEPGDVCGHCGQRVIAWKSVETIGVVAH